jgi:DNA-directed RNA polymerase specialized sigma24 family protein
VSRRSSLKRIETITARLAALDSQRDAAVAAAVGEGCSWAEIGTALGVSAQAAHKRFRWIRHSPITGDTWHEPPLPA